MNLPEMSSPAGPGMGATGPGWAGWLQDATVLVVPSCAKQLCFLYNLSEFSFGCLLYCFQGLELYIAGRSRKKWVYVIMSQT